MPIYKMDGKKDGRQQYRVRINYTDNAGKQHQLDRVAYGAAEAKNLEAELKAAYKGRQAPESRMTVAELFDEYKIAKSSEIRASSFQNMTKYIHHHVIPFLGDVKLTKLSAPELQRWKNYITEKGLAITTCQHIYSELRGLLNYAVKMGYMVKNPLTTVGNFRDAYFQGNRERIHFYTPDEFTRYIAVAKTQAEQRDTIVDWGYYVFFAIAFYTGARKGEINALRWSDIDGNVIHVRRSVTQKLRCGDVETPPKNKTSYRDIQAPAPLMAILDDHKKRQYAAYTDSTDNCDLRICGGTECLRDTSIENRNIAFAAAAGLPHIRIHDFRHSHASLLANNGINIQEIARRLGHSDIKMTWDTYSHLYPSESDRATAVLDKIG